MPGFRTGRPDISAGGGGGPVVVWVPDLSTATVVRATSKTYEDTPGHVVTIGPNLPAMDYRGLSVDALHTNLALRSAEFDNASWLPASAVVAVPTMLGNAGPAPDGTLTADRMDLPAVAANEVSVIYQTFLATPAVHTFSLWARAVTPGSSIYLYLINTTNGFTGTAYRTLIQPSNAVWQRYTLTPPALTNVNWGLGIGVRSVAGGGQDPQAASSTLLWGGQVELSGFARSYVATAGASATCNQDNVDMSPTLLPTTSGSVEVSVTTLWNVAANPQPFNFIYDTRGAGPANGMALVIASGALLFGAHNGVTSSNLTSAALTWNAGQAYAVRATWGAGNAFIYRDGVLVASDVTGTFPMPMTNSQFKIGRAFSDAFPLDGYISNLVFYDS